MTKQIDLSETVENIKYDPLVRIEPDGSEVRLLQPATKADILKEAIKIMDNIPSLIYKELGYIHPSFVSCQDVINYIQSLLEEDIK